VPSKAEVEEVENYYRNNPSKPRGKIQYEDAIGPKSPHANVKIGKKELGPTRADLEQHQDDLEEERQQKFHKKMEIESAAHAVRLKQEKADAEAAKEEEARLKKKWKKEQENEAKGRRQIRREVGNTARNIGSIARGGPPAMHPSFPTFSSGFGSSGSPSFPKFGGSGDMKFPKTKVGSFGSSGFGSSGFPKLNIGKQKTTKKSKKPFGSLGIKW